MTSQKPVPVIIISLVFTLLGCLGLLLLRVENNAIKLWIPQQSDFTRNYHWLYENYPPEIRQHSIIIHGDDVLTPKAIQKVSFLSNPLSTQSTLHRKYNRNKLLLTFIRMDHLYKGLNYYTYIDPICRLAHIHIWHIWHYPNSQCTKMTWIKSWYVWWGISNLI